MSQVEKALEELIQSIKDSPEYNRYQEIRAGVREHPELERQIHEYRRLIYETHNSVGNWDLFEQVDRLEREYAEFRNNPLVREYLASELALCRLLQNINLSIIRNIDFDVGFVNG